MNLKYIGLSKKHNIHNINNINNITIYKDNVNNNMNVVNEQVETKEIDLKIKQEETK